jgi:hypothetical protein
MGMSSYQVGLEEDSVLPQGVHDRPQAWEAQETGKSSDHPGLSSDQAGVPEKGLVPRLAALDQAGVPENGLFPRLAALDLR